MVMRVLVVAALAVALMIGVKDGKLLRTAGLTGTCLVTQTYSDGTQLESCRAGKLQGQPDLSTDGCRQVGQSGPYVYWRCPAAVASQAGGR